MWVTNAKIVGIVLGTLALYTLIANKIPQVQSEVPQTLTLGANVTSEQLVAAGEKVFNGIGGCTTCHGLGTRAPNLLTDEKGTGSIGARCAKRESGKSCKQYLYESLDNPTAYVVQGYQPIMPVMTRQLSPPQVWSVIAFLESMPDVERMYGDIHRFVAGWLPDYARDNRNYLTVAIGCTGGKHRSAYLVERLARTFAPQYQVQVRHRELG